jgi:hypothetical protein
MAKVINIKQNPQRYTQLTDSWQISASPSIRPVSFKKGQSVSNLKPVLSVDGIIVKAGEWFLCSPATLAALQQSRNPHYAIESNGPIGVKTKSVVIGKTIRMIEIDITKLKEIGDNLDFGNRKASVSYVDYIYEGDTQDGVPINLIRQIDYTLNPTITRPSDKFGLHSMELGDDDTVYSIAALNTATKQSDGTLDKTKLELFLKNLQNRITVLRRDFNMIKDVFYNGTLPDSQVTIDFQQVADSGVNSNRNEEPPVLFKYTTLAEVVEAPVSTPASGSTETGTNGATNGEPATQAAPVIKKLKMRKQHALTRNSIPVFEKDFSNGDKGKRIKYIREGDIFYGYFIKDLSGGRRQWAVYEQDKKTFIGYGDADSNDYVDEEE